LARRSSGLIVVPERPIEVVEVPMMKLVARAAVAMVIAGCVSRAPFVPARRDVAQPSAALYKAAVRVLSEAGFEIDDKDTAAGLVVTEWQIADQVLQSQRRVRWRVIVDEGEVVVGSDCQVGDEGAAASWSRCGEQQSEGRSEEAARLADAIVRAVR
jgi:hypothetical protein